MQIQQRQDRDEPESCTEQDSEQGEHQITGQPCKLAVKQPVQAHTHANLICRQPQLKLMQFCSVLSNIIPCASCTYAPWPEWMVLSLANWIWEHYSSGWCQP